MYHVMDADGVRQDAESRRDKELLSETYGLMGPELNELVSAGQQADSEAIDLYAFTSVLKRHLDEDARIRFIRILWDVVYADGELHELEDNTLWRVAELIGVDRRDRIAMRQEAARLRPDARGASSETNKMPATKQRSSSSCIRNSRRAGSGSFSSRRASTWIRDGRRWATPCRTRYKVMPVVVRRADERQ